jgi:hypothetical protein
LCALQRWRATLTVSVSGRGSVVAYDCPRAYSVVLVVQLRCVYTCPVCMAGIPHTLLCQAGFGC